MATRQTNLSKRLVNKTLDLASAKKQITAHEKTIKEQSDQIGAYQSEVNRLEGLLKQREEQGGFIATENDGYLTNLVETQPYNVWIPLQEVDGVNIREIVKNPLHKKFPCFKLNDNKIEVDTQRLNKIKLGGIL